jgi:ketosteroid isomerase-like protein
MLKMTTLVAGAALLASVPAGAQVDLRAARESLRAADRAVSESTQARGIRDGLLPYLADSAHVLAPGTTLARGREQAAEALVFGPAAGARLRWEPIRLDVSADGRSGYSYGAGTRTAADGAEVHARYIAYWRRGGDGWKLAAFMFNASPQPVTPPPAGFFPAPPATGSVPANVDVAAALEAARQADRDFAAFAAARNVGAAFQAYAAPDGAMLAGEYGPQAIGAAFAGGRGTLEWGPTGGAASAAGDLAYTVGTAVRRGEDGIPLGYTKYLSIWRLQPNGEWKWVVDGGNARPADEPGR